ncbi:Bbp16 family capsid cement protein [Nonomuraea salmonea]
MGHPVALYIDVKSDNPELLQIKIVEETRTIGPGQSTTFQVTMNATPDTSGDATVTVQLKTPDGQPYGKPQRLTIRTTGYTGIALVIVGAALTVMLAAVVTRLLRRRSQRKLARTKTRESETV